MPAFSSPNIKAFTDFCKAESKKLHNDNSLLKTKDRKKAKKLVLSVNEDGLVPKLDSKALESLYDYVALSHKDGSAAAKGLIELYAHSHPEQAARILTPEATKSVSEPDANKSPTSEALSTSSHDTPLVTTVVGNKKPSMSGYTVALMGAPNFLDFQLRTNISGLITQAEDSAGKRSAITDPFLALLKEVYRDNPNAPSSIAAEDTIKRFLLDNRAAYDRRQHIIWGNLFKFSDNWLGLTKPPRVQEHNAIVYARELCLGNTLDEKHNLHSETITALGANKIPPQSQSAIAAPKAASTVPTNITRNTNAVTLEPLEDFAQKASSANSDSPRAVNKNTASVDTNKQVAASADNSREKPRTSIQPFTEISPKILLPYLASNSPLGWLFQRTMSLANILRFKPSTATSQSVDSSTVRKATEQSQPRLAIEASNTANNADAAQVAIASPLLVDELVLSTEQSAPSEKINLVGLDLGNSTVTPVHSHQIENEVSGRKRSNSTARNAEFAIPPTKQKSLPRPNFRATPPTSVNLNSAPAALATPDNLNSASAAPLTPVNLNVTSAAPSTPVNLNSASVAPPTPVNLNSASAAPATPDNLNSASAAPATPNNLNSVPPAAPATPPKLNNNLFFSPSTPTDINRKPRIEETAMTYSPGETRTTRATITHQNKDYEIKWRHLGRIATETQKLRAELAASQSAVADENLENGNRGYGMSCGVD